MKKFNSILAFAVLVALPFAFNACKDEVKPDAPTVAGPAAVTAVQAGASSDITFTVTIPGGYKSSTVTANGGTAAIKTDGTVGGTTASIVVTFTAGATAGAGSVTITTTDNNSKIGTATAVLGITIPGSPTVTAPTATTAVVTTTPVDITFATTVPGKFSSATVTATGGTAVVKTPLAANATSGNIVVTYTGTTAGAGSVTLTVKDVNNLTSFATAVTSVSLPAPVSVTGIITASTSWTKNNKYILQGNVYVQAPAVLTIEAGTVIFGDKLTKGALIISRGAKIIAKGTATSPIVFTSSAPQGFRNYGDWGGVVILGFAQNNQSADQAIEGISAPTGDNGKYGIATKTAGATTTENDDSGELSYARIEFAGIALSTDNELNGLTLGSVGSTTKINNIQVSYSGDDSYEWFGGTVNGSYLIAYRGWDDEFDTDFGYTGSNQFLVSYRDPNIADKSGSNGFESDNNAQGDAKTPLTAPIFANVSFFGPFAFANPSNSTTNTAGALNTANISSNFQRAAHIRRNTAMDAINCVFIGYRDGIFFDQTNAAAIVRGNFLGRHSGTVKLYTINGLGGSAVYSDANFFAENTVNGYTTPNPLTSLNTITSTALDLSANFAGGAIDFSWISAAATATTPAVTTTLSKVLWNLNAPNPLLSANSSLLTGAAAIPASTTGFTFQTVAYRGAFDATNNWSSSTWTNYDPNNTAY
jgi:hypothetical protein